MGVFNPTLESEVVYQQPIQAPKQYNALTGVADFATTAIKTFGAMQSSSSKSADGQIIEAFSQEMLRASDLKEQGKPYKSIARAAQATLIGSGIKNVPDRLDVLYRGVTGEPLLALGYEDEQDYNEAQLLATDAARTLAVGVKINNPSYNQDQVETEVLNTLGKTAVLEEQLRLENARAANGLPVRAQPIVETMQNDFDLLSSKLIEYQEDGIITRDEYLSAVTSVRSLISTKYAAFKDNAQVKAIQEQMFGLLDDVGKGVSTDPLEVQLDAIQVALTKANFNPATIATIRSMIKTNPETFRQKLLDQFGERGETWIDGIVDIWNAPASGVKIEDIFGTRPQVSSTAGDNPSLMIIPDVDADPDKYSSVVENLSEITANANPTNLKNNEATRNEWLNGVNILGSLVASQSDQYVLGEKLLNLFASNGIIDNLRVIYDSDPSNAAQTNDVLQQAISSELGRQKNELDTRLASGDGQYFRVDPDTNELKFNLQVFEDRVNAETDPSRKRSLQTNFENLVKSVQKIEDLGGLSYYFGLPENKRRELLQDTPMFERFFNIQLKDSFKLIKNINLLTGKLDQLTDLASKNEYRTTAFDNKVFADEALETIKNTMSITSLGKMGSRDDPYIISGDISIEEQKKEYDAVPSGQFFIDPNDNKLYKKP